MGDRGHELTGRTLPEPPAHSVSDINECRRYPGRLCGHKCENTPGSYYCSCTMGFRLSSDGRSCEGEGRRGALGLHPLLFPKLPASLPLPRQARLGTTHLHPNTYQVMCQQERCLSEVACQR